MCGIIGYIGLRQAQPILLSGLRRLEYRGYDSSGIAILSSHGSVFIRKTAGKISFLEKLLATKQIPGSVGIAHTRWATHGAPTQINAHPHHDCSSNIFLVHNGIIENYAILKRDLISQGHKFRSETDTEVIVHLIERFYRSRVPLEEAVRKALRLLHGSFALVVISKSEPDKMIGARLGSPLILGLGQKEYFLASDVPAILDSTKEVIFLNDYEMVLLKRESFCIEDFAGRKISHRPVHISWDVTQAEKQSYPHFMLKEINEQPRISEEILKLRVKKDKEIIHFGPQEILNKDTLKKIRSIHIVACGTAYHAGLVGKYILESLCRMPVFVDVSSEFRYRDLTLDRDSLVIAVSQSGETADTLAGVRQARRLGIKTLAICNVVGSTLTRESHATIYTHAGPEIGVASTKAYTAQLLIFYLFSFYLAQIRKTLSSGEQKEFLKSLWNIPGQQRTILRSQQKIAELAEKHAHFGSFLFLGRNINYPSALEGALKLKEISYIPAEGYAAGEMKHGPIALIDEYRAVVCICPYSKVYDKMISNIQEIRSRQGKLIIIATQGDEKIKTLAKEIIYVPWQEEIFSPLLVALPLQLLAYHISVKRGCDVDQPRNLAKSVTVE